VCDYCDCRSHPEIADLSSDHEALTSMLGRLRSAVQAEDRFAAAALVTTVHDTLHSHATREEHGVFAALRAQVGDAYVRMFEDDHPSIHELLDRADGDDWVLACTGLVELLGDHILREESDLFPAAHQLLTSDQWARITEDQLERTGSHP
jgi:hemerythrin-like domain-containing protein